MARPRSPPLSACARLRLFQAPPCGADPDPVSEASHFGAGVAALVFWALFGVLASNVVPNFLALFAGPLSVATDGLVTAAASTLTPSVVLFLYGRQML